MRRVLNEDFHNFDKKGMREAYEAAIDAGFLKEETINFAKSYKLELVDWTAGIIYKLGNDFNVIVYSFTDHKILITMDDNDGIRVNPECYESSDATIPDTFFVDVWDGSHVVQCPVNRKGILFGKSVWFRFLNRIRSDKPIFIGKDVNGVCMVFDLNENVILKEQGADYTPISGGVFIKDVTKTTSTLYDKHFDVVIDDIDKYSWIHCMYLEPNDDRKYLDTTICVVESNGKKYLFKKGLECVVGDVDEIKSFMHLNVYGNTIDTYCVRKGKKWNIVGRNGILLFGDSDWVDSVEDIKGHISFLKVTRNGLQNLVALDIIELIDTNWHNEIVPTRDGFAVGYKTLGAFSDTSGCNLIGADFRDKGVYKRLILKESVDDIKTCKRFIFVMKDGKQYVLWHGGHLIQANHDEMFEIFPLVYVLAYDGNKIDLARTDKPYSFCDKYMGGKKLDYCSIADNDVLGIIEYNGKFSYVNFVAMVPAICDENGSIKWFDSVEQAEKDSILRTAKCVVTENGKRKEYHVKYN